MRVPIEVNFTQRVAIDVALHTPDGVPLGEPVRLSVHSNAYGKVLFVITLSAAAVLVALAGRRLWHRFRGQPDRADLDRPGPAGRRARRHRRRAERMSRAMPPRGVPRSPGTADRPAAADRSRAGAGHLAAAPTRALRRRAGVPVVGHGAGDTGQPRHRLRPDRAAGRDPGRGSVQRVHGGQPAAEPGRRAGAGGDVHRDLRAGARPRRARRRRRRCGFRAPPGDAGHHACCWARRCCRSPPRPCWCS